MHDHEKLCSELKAFTERATDPHAILKVDIYMAGGYCLGTTDTLRMYKSVYKRTTERDWADPDFHHVLDSIRVEALIGLLGLHIRSGDIDAALENAHELSGWVGNRMVFRSGEMPSRVVTALSSSSQLHRLNDFLEVTLPEGSSEVAARFLSHIESLHRRYDLSREEVLESLSILETHTTDGDILEKIQTAQQRIGAYNPPTYEYSTN